MVSAPRRDVPERPSPVPDAQVPVAPEPGRPVLALPATDEHAAAAPDRQLHHHRFARGRLAAVSVGAAIAAGAWVGLAIGLLLGAALGAVLAWLAGAILAWQQDLGLTLGVVRNLLPFGDQVPILRTLSNYWYLVIPGVSIVSGIVGAVITALIGGLLAGSYNRSPRHATVLVELPPTAEADGAPGRDIPDEGGPAGR